MKTTGLKISALVFGLLTILAGISLIGFNTGFLPLCYKPIIFSWQMLLIAIGFVGLFSPRKWGFGIVLMLIGGFFMLQKLNIERLDFITRNGWAILLILLGVVIICKTIWLRRFLPGRSFNQRSEKSKEWHKDYTTEWKKRQNETGYLERNYVFGGSKEKLDISDFKGGEISCVFGGTELDLTDCQLAEGTHTLEISTVFGGVVLYVPSHWRIEIRQNRVFGSFEDRRPAPNFEVDENKALIIDVSAVFGGGEIKIKS